MNHRLSSCCLFAWMLFQLLTPLAAEPPRVWALTGARVVPQPGELVEDATVVIRDGRIEDVGPGVAIPADAVEIDASDHWIYPAWLDADSRLELAIAVDDPETGFLHPWSRIRPERRASAALADLAGEHQRDVRRLRELGFGAIAIAPRRGILRGTGAVVVLADGLDRGQLIVRDDVAQHAAFERGRFGEGYPTSLMGAAAALRQTFLDAQRHQLWQQRWQRSPRGLRRPPHRPALVALRPLLDRLHPLVVHVSDPRDALLAHRLCEEFELELIVAASGHEWEIAAELAAAGRPLLLPLAAPDRPDVDEPSDALDVSLETMRRYVESASGPARLHERGVRFALVTRGLKSVSDLPDRLRAIVDAGLPESVVLAALTTVPAELLGVGELLGTVETGKIANLIVSDGPILAEGTRVIETFVDGVRHDVEQDDRLRGDPDAVVDPRGRWSVVLDFGSRSVDREWTIDGQPGAWRGSAEIQSGTVDFETVELSGNALTVTYPAREGRGGMEVTVIIEGDRFEGVAEIGSRTARIRGSRRPEHGGGTW